MVIWNSFFAGDSQIGAWDVKAIRKKIEIPERKGIFDLGIGAYLLNPLKTITPMTMWQRISGRTASVAGRSILRYEKAGSEKADTNRWQRMELTRHMWHFMEKTH